jgi:hypothetical protein
MRTNWMLATAAVAMSVTAAAAASVTAVVDAQSAKAMAKPAKGETMEMAYTGCVVSVDHGGEFLLTKVDSVGAQASADDRRQDGHHAIEVVLPRGCQPEQTRRAEGVCHGIARRWLEADDAPGCVDADGQDSESDREDMLMRDRQDRRELPAHSTCVVF